MSILRKMTIRQNLLKLNSIIIHHYHSPKKITNILKIRREPIPSLPLNSAKIFRGQNSKANRRALKIVYVSAGQDSGDSGESTPPDKVPQITYRTLWCYSRWLLHSCWKGGPQAFTMKKSFSLLTAPHCTVCSFHLVVTWSFRYEKMTPA